VLRLKFNYVVAAQVYGKMKKSQDGKAKDIEWLLHRYPNLRVVNNKSSQYESAALHARPRLDFCVLFSLRGYHLPT
jgi:hypothetical protein